VGNNIFVDLATTTFRLNPVDGGSIFLQNASIFTTHKTTTKDARLTPLQLGSIIHFTYSQLLCVRLLELSQKTVPFVTSRNVHGFMQINPKS